MKLTFKVKFDHTNETAVERAWRTYHVCVGRFYQRACDSEAGFGMMCGSMAHGYCSAGTWTVHIDSTMCQRFHYIERVLLEEYFDITVVEE